MLLKPSSAGHTHTSQLWPNSGKTTKPILEGKLPIMRIRAAALLDLTNARPARITHLQKPTISANSKETCVHIPRLAGTLKTSTFRLRRMASAGAIFTVLMLATLISVRLGGVALAQEGTVKGQHGDWQIVCKDPPPGSKNEVCALVQSVTAEDRDNIGLTVYFQKFSNGTRVLRVFAPLGILLPPGLGLKIDDKDVGHAPFLRCHTFACYAQVVVEDSLVKQLETGKTAIFIIFQTEEAGIGIPISLAGFKEALEELK